MCKVILSGTFVIEPIKSALMFWSSKLPSPFNFAFAPYNQLFHQLIDPKSQTSQNKGGINVLLIRGSDLNHSRANLEMLAESISSNASKVLAQYIVAVCPDRTVASDKALAWEEALLLSLANIQNMTLVTSQELLSYCQEEYCFDPLTDEMAHIPYTLKFYTALATVIARKIYVFSQPKYKVLVVDCDHTLWRGICGEDPLSAIEVSPPFKMLQSFLLQQRQWGRLLCLASKNHAMDVATVFQAHPDMILQWEHFTAHRINWQAKSQNIKSLAAELKLGLDSFIFIDDNPVECAEVRAHCPEVLTLCLPANVELIPEFMRRLWIFDQGHVTAEDAQRSEFYQQNKEREKIQHSSTSLEEFISNLQLEVDIRIPQIHEISRLAQLTMRTNQFNFTTIRRQEMEILALQKELRAVSVKDRFGDYGLVGCMIFDVEGDSLVVESFLLSCRVLSRGVELQMLTFLGQLATSRGIPKLTLQYSPTPKNQPALNFLQFLKGSPLGTSDLSVELSATSASSRDIACATHTQLRRTSI